MAGRPLPLGPDQPAEMSLHIESPIVRTLVEAQDLRPGDWAVRDVETSLTYEQLVSRVSEEATGLAGAGAAPGALLLVEALNSVDYLVSYLGALQVGVHVLPLDPSATSAEVEREVQTYGVRFHLTPGRGPVRERLGRLGEPCQWTPLASGRGLISLSTSGTGGLPKRATFSQDRLLGNAAAHAQAVGLTSDDVCLVTLSPAFAYCHTAQILAALVTRGRLVFPPRPALPQEIGRVLAEFEVTTTTLVPHQLSDRMLAALRKGSRLRQLNVGSSPMSRALIERVMELLPRTELVHTWGMTEAGPRLTTWRSSRDRHKIGSVGLPIAGVSVLESDQQVDSSSGESAGRELFVRSPFVMDGYLGAPQETASILPEPNLVRTGDLGFVDDEGYVFLSGRLKNLIDVGGKKVSPEEIEAVLMSYPGVHGARVRPENSAQRGQEPVAEVLVAQGASVDAGALASYVRGQLSRHKWPRRIDIVCDMERTTNGKVRRW